VHSSMTAVTASTRHMATNQDYTPHLFVMCTVSPASFAKLSGFDIAKGKPKESLRMASRPALGLTQLGYQVWSRRYVVCSLNDVWKFHIHA